MRLPARCQRLPQRHQQEHADEKAKPDEDFLTKFHR
jgi:hypothetical protein